ncbi:MAG: RHS repeat protein, partial [Acidobacteria bacterium]|nr:RHS repeat protein [Acidobacteriota bacterium]
VTSFEYDALKRMTRKTYSSGGSIVYVYEGSVLKQVDDTVASPSETHVFGYDTMLRMTSATQGPRGTLTYTYANDRVATMQIQGGPANTYAYHPDGSLKQIDWSPVPGSFTYAYTPGGQYSEITFPNGQKRTYQYDAQGRLTNLANTLGATTLAAFSYGYDMNHQTGQATQLGQRTSLTMTLPHQSIANAEQRFFYDALYQLTRAEYPTPTPFNGESHSWTYDAIGNRLTSTVNATTQTYTYLKNGANPNNGQRLANDGVNAYTYDAAGNTVTRTGFTFGYNADNRLSSIKGNETASYTYDYQGRRTSKTVAGVTTTYLYDGLNLIAETAAGQTSYFLNGPGIDEPLAMSKAGQVSFLSADALGTIVVTNDPAGTVTHSVVLDAWGNTKSDVGTRTHPFTYTGRETDEVGLLFYRVRYYTPATGRFLQEDKLAGFAARYRYVSNRPVEFVDSRGLVCEVRVYRQPRKFSLRAGWRRGYLEDVGHQWIEWPGDSVGFWPDEDQPGAFGIKMGRVHHPDELGNPQVPKNGFPSWETYWKGAVCPCDAVHKCLADFADRFSSAYSVAWGFCVPGTENCWTFTDTALAACGLSTTNPDIELPPIPAFP